MPRSEESRQKTRDAIKAAWERRKQDPGYDEWRAAQSAARTGKKTGPCSDLRRERIREATTGKPKGPVGHANIAAANKARAGSKRNPELNAQQSARLKGKPNPGFSERMRAWWANPGNKARMAEIRRGSVRQDTSIERAVCSVLTDFGIAFDKQVPLGGFITDVCIPRNRLVIECDGDYWHSLEGNRARDERKNRWMWDEEYHLVRLRESDINADPVGCVVGAIRKYLEVEMEKGPFREERHRLFKRAIDESIGSLMRQENLEGLAARTIDVAFGAYRHLGPLSRDPVGGRSRKDLFFSVLRQTGTSFRHSWCAKIALKMLKLDTVLDAVEVYLERIKAFSQTGHLLRLEEEKYDKHFASALAIAESYNSINDEPCRLYASLKSWSSNEELEQTQELIEEYTLGKWELVVAGPIQLLLQIGAEGILLIWRALTWGGGRTEPRDNDAKIVANTIYDIVKKQNEDGIARVFSDLLIRVIHYYMGLWIEEQRRVRSYVPIENKDRFFEAFERGTFFAKQSDKLVQP